MMCRENLLSEELTKLGYVWRSDFFEGNITGQPMALSWKGSANLTWDEISKKVYDNSPKPIKKSKVDLKTGKFRTEFLANNLTKLSLIPEDCTIIEDISNWMQFGEPGGGELKVLISDPHLQLSYRQNKIGISGDELESTKGYSFFEIKISILQLRRDKNVCRDYDTADGYKQCAEKSARKKLIDLLGCIPPWMSQLDNEPICYDAVEFKDKKQAEHVKSQMSLIVNFIYLNYEDALNLEGECKLPCSQIHLSVKKIKKFGYNNYNSLIMKFDDSVKIIEEKNGYDLFALMVEVGSSLGLWLGLSAIGVFDLLSQFLYWSVEKVRKI